MSTDNDTGSVGDGADRGRTPSQWFTRLLGLGLLAGAVAAVVASWDDIRRYARMERM